MSWTQVGTRVLVSLTSVLGVPSIGLDVMKILGVTGIVNLT